MKPMLFFLMFVLCNGAAQAQHYLSAGAGFGLMQFDSRDLDLFQNTYNRVNAGFGQNVLLRGFDLGVGLSGEMSYRYLGNWSHALTFGYQEYSATDVAGFADGNDRNLRLNANHIYVQPSFGLNKRGLFVEGLITIYGARRFKLNSTLLKTEQANSLTGVYEAQASYAMDAGIACGGLSGPIMLLVKLSYPVRKTDATKILSDPDPAKARDGLENFPADFVNYVALQPYKGLASDIDGFKIVITLSYALRLSKPREEEGW
jgi:hypothetical protein